MLKNEHPLKTVGLKVLEDWAMMLVEEILEPSVEIFDENQKLYMSNVSLSGVISGSVSIVSQLPFMQTLAQNILGTDNQEVLLESDLLDAFKEMGNVLAGNFITEGYGEDIAFDLLNPAVDETDFSKLDQFLQRSIIFTFLADDNPIAISFHIKQG